MDSSRARKSAHPQRPCDEHGHRAAHRVPEPGRFSVVEAASGGTASFGCANVGDYSFEQTDSGGLRVHEVADSCEPRVEVLIAGVWTGLPLITATDGLSTDETITVRLHLPGAGAHGLGSGGRHSVSRGAGSHRAAAEHPVTA